MKVRITLICTLLLLAAVPSFAAPPCQVCDQWGSGLCASEPFSHEVCRTTSAGCKSDFGYCIGRSDTTILTEWQVASIEISRPALDSITVTAPVQVTEVPTATPQAVELK